MQTIKRNNESFQVVDVLANQIGKYELIDILAAREIKGNVFKFIEISFNGNGDTNANLVEHKSYLHTKGTIESMKQFINPTPFERTWEKFKKPIEMQVASNIKSGHSYTAKSLLHDCMIVTSSYEMSLECVYQSLLLLNGWEQAKLFREEMISNINWIIDMVEFNYLDYKSEVV